MKTEHAISLEGNLVEFEVQVLAQGAVKDVHFTKDHQQVVAFFRGVREGTDAYAFLKERLKRITGDFRRGIFAQHGGDYWRGVFCWPEAVVEHKGRIGVVVPVYPQSFFFQYGSSDGDALQIRGCEKEGKWFTSAINRFRYLDERERGKLPGYFRACIQLSRAVRRLHAAGLAHSDLSYRNVLFDPVAGRAALIDLDGLVVPGLFPPDVVGTPDFIAPEVLSTRHLPIADPSKSLPSRLTDLHALAVLIYMYLFCRHPLRGRKVHDQDPLADELLTMGEGALFIEHSKDHSNRPEQDFHGKEGGFWMDVERMPCSVAGPYLEKLFRRAFEDGLHQPTLRPSAQEWEQALVKTVDLLLPCQNTGCSQGWFVYSNQTRPACPYCQTLLKGVLPVLDFYSAPVPGKYQYDQHRMAVYHGLNLYPWHANIRIEPSERLEENLRRPVADFVEENGEWYLLNRNLPDLKDATTGIGVPVGEKLHLAASHKILLSSEEGGRVFAVTLVAN